MAAEVSRQLGGVGGIYSGCPVRLRPWIRLMIGCVRLMPRRVPIMASRISELIIPCQDPQRLAAFWCEVLGFVVLDSDDGAVEIGPREGFGGLQPTLIFSPTTEWLYRWIPESFTGPPRGLRQTLSTAEFRHH